MTLIMTKQVKNWSPPEVELLISAYESHQFLWDLTHKSHKDRLKTNLAHKEIADSFETSSEEVARKLHNLKGQFHQELIKIKKKRRAGGATENWTSNWRYFNSLSFLLKRKQVDTNASDTLYETSSGTEAQETLIERQHIERKTFKLPEKSKKRRKHDILGKCAKILNQSSDDDQIFGDYIASELRKLSKENNKKLRRIIQRTLLELQDEEDNIALHFSLTTSDSDSSN